MIIVLLKYSTSIIFYIKLKASIARNKNKINLTMQSECSQNFPNCNCLAFWYCFIYIITSKAKCQVTVSV